MANAVILPTSQRISLLVEKLPAEQQIELEKQLSLLVLRNEAKRLEKSVVKNSISMKEIIDEVRKARHAK